MSEITEALERIFSADSTIYQQRGFQRRVGFGERPALINIDLANAWTRPGNAFSCDGMDVIIPGVQRLLGHPKTRRVYLRVLGELLQGYWSADGATPWLVALQRATGHSTGGVRNHITGGARRIEAALRGVENASFRIVTESGEDFTTGDAAVEIEGEAPIAVETIAYRRGAEDPRTLEPVWSSVRRWSVLRRP